jgi:hypothetical protein
VRRERFVYPAGASPAPVGDFYREISAPLPRGLVLIVQTETGDSIWLDTKRKRPDGDCRVFLLSHETGESEREWPSAAEFLEELLTAGGN